jgi:NADH pyrophosphatase NudC (nudix superfamily)
MEVKQIFVTYPRDKNIRENRFRFCALCGTKLGRVTKDKPAGKCPACGFVHYENPAPAVSVLVASGENVLLCRRSPGKFQGGKWCLPCGYIEFEEDYLTAAVREVKEETGLDIRIKSILSMVSNFFTPDLHTAVIVLLAQPVGGEIRCADDAENDAVQWFPLAGPLPEMAFEADSHIIERYFKTKLSGAPVDPDYSRE